MKTYYGVDSVDLAPNVLPNLKQHWGVLPSMYARYVVGGFVTSKWEVDAIIAEGIRVVHVCNFGDAGTVGGSFDAGSADARVAVIAMRATQVPDGGKGLLFRDIESGWVPSVDYLKGWSTFLQNAQQPGGFYANGQWATFDTPYASLVGVVDRLYRLVWTSEPENVGYVPPPGPTWNPYGPPSDPSAIVGWQFVEQPPQIPNIDCNLWTEEAYNLAYAGAVAPVALVWHAKTTCALKPGPDPSHTTPSLHTIYGGDVIVKTGREDLDGTPPTNWIEVTAHDKQGKAFVGWMLKDNAYHD